jgi:hypothetical protein
MRPSAVRRSLLAWLAPAYIGFAAWLLACPCLSLAAAAASSASDVLLLAPVDADEAQRSAVRLVLDEVEKRTRVRWSVRYGASNVGHGARTRIIAARLDQIAALFPAAPADRFQRLRAPNATDMRAQLNTCAALSRPEGYAIRSLVGPGGHWVFVIGHDDRGMLFGLGHLLRKSDWMSGHVRLAIQSACVAPAMAVRGHQLGYRLKSNTYDGWNGTQFEQYVRDLAIFGTNTIELLPPVTDDAPSSPLFPQPALEMMIEVSGLLRQYGLRCSVFYPAMARDYADPVTVRRELDAWESVLRQLPEVDELFVPGGDPGHTAPDLLFSFLGQLAPRLHRYHPTATIWVSAQGFDAAQMEALYRLVARRPSWLSGIVFGPQSRDSFYTQRARIPSDIPMRLYPDIAHTAHSQFPVPRWDPSFALTEGREPIDPRPQAETRIFEHFNAGVGGRSADNQRTGLENNDLVGSKQNSHTAGANGFITYSEGVNDDVNKFIWTALGVDPSSTPTETLADYARWFAGHQLQPALLHGFATGLQDLERNWNGPLETNTSIPATLDLFRHIERAAPEAARNNWRVQLAVYRAWFDAYEQLRARAEARTERDALKLLKQARRLGSEHALEAAEAALRYSPDRKRVAMRAHIDALGGALFNSIRLQLSVARYHASAVDRGANLDTLDVSVHDRFWLARRFDEIRKLRDESEQLRAINALLAYEHPVPGAYYDDLGEPGHEPHLVRPPSDRDDPDLRHEPHDGIADFRPDDGWRRSSVTYAAVLYDEALVLAYDHLDKHARYRLRVTYAGEDYTLPMRLVANDHFEIHPPRLRASNPETVEFEVPPEATASGTLKLAWTRPPGGGGSGRGAQVAEVWLIPDSRRGTPPGSGGVLRHYQ